MTTPAPEAISIRPAERADLLAVYRIEQVSFPQPWPFRAFEGFLGQPGFLVAVAEPTVGLRDGGGGTAGSDGRADDAGESVREAGDADDVGAPGDVCGYVVADVVSEFGRTIGHVKDLAVAPGFRARGIGARLLDRALAVIAGGGARRAKLEVRVDNETARALYADFGFSTRKVVPGYYDDGEDALLLVADLSDRAAVDDR